MYSSKVSTTRSLLKLVEFFGGVLLTKTGGMVSLGPPVGGTTTAHLGKKRFIRNRLNIINTMRFNAIGVLFR